MATQRFDEAEFPEEKQLARILRKAREAGPSAEFKRRARALFLSQASPGSGSRKRKLERSAEPMLTDTEDRMRALLGTPAADGAFKIELRRRFMAYVPGSDQGAAGQPDGESDRQPRGIVFRIAVLAAAAAAAIFVTFYLPAEAHWRVSGTEAPEGLVLDGRPMEQTGLDSSGELAAFLARGARLSTSGQPLDLDLSLGLRLRVLPNSSIEFFPLPDAGSHHELAFALEIGEIYLETSAEYLGNPIRIETKDAEVMVSGTALGVLVDGLGTCTCVEHGRVSVTRAKEVHLPAEGVEAGHSLFILRDGEPKRSRFDERGDVEHDRHVSEFESFAAAR